MKKRHTTDTNELEDELQSWLSNARKVVVTGIGNPLRKDDFVGVEIVRNLREKVSQLVYLVECETVPESFIGPITKFKPTHILLIDAGILNQKHETHKTKSNGNPDSNINSCATSSNILQVPRKNNGC